MVIMAKDKNPQSLTFSIIKKPALSGSSIGIIIGIVVAILVIGGGIYFYKKKKDSSLRQQLVWN